MESLAPDALEAVLRRLEVEDVCHVAKCSQYLSGACCSDELWRHLYLARWPLTPNVSVVLYVLSIVVLYCTYCAYCTL